MLSVMIVPMTMIMYQATAIARVFRFKASCLPLTIMSTAKRKENHAKFNNPAPKSRPKLAKVKNNALFGAIKYIRESRIAAKPQERKARK